MISRLARSRALRRATRLLSLTAVVALAMPLIAANAAVAVVVDGEEHQLQTYAATVGDVLEELEVEVEPVDEVSPSLDASVEDGIEIEVARAVTVDVHVDGEHVETVEEPVGSVAGALDAVDLDVREEGALITPGWTEPIEDGDVIDVRLPADVELTADGDTDQFETHMADVEALLLDADVHVGDDDVVIPASDTPLHEVDEVLVQRVETDEVVEEIVLERDEVRQETGDLEQGTTRVDDEGRDGLRHDTYRLELVDGEEADRELVDQEVVTEPRDRVVLVGTRQPEPEPEPEPEPAPTPTPSTSGTSHWDELAECESNGNWRANTGNGYHGGLQFHPDTWNRHKPSGYPQYAYQASREQQIAVGERVQASQGWAAWPHCSRVVGLR